MRQRDEVFATVLLLSQLDTRAPETFKPLTANEWYDLRRAVGLTDIGHLGNLLTMDISGIQASLDMDEAQAFRIHGLLNRSVQLSYSLENLFQAGIDIVTLDEPDYPRLLIDKLGEKAPPMIYYAGNLDLANRPLVALSSSFASRNELEMGINVLTPKVVNAGFGIVCGGSYGADEYIQRAAHNANGQYVSVVSGALSEKANDPFIKNQIAAGNTLLMSVVHPSAAFTGQHALQSNKLIYALSCAAFVFVSNLEKGNTWAGATEAMRLKLIDRLYVWNLPTQKGNQRLITMGAVPVTDLQSMTSRQIARQWPSCSAEQLSFF